MEQASKDKKVAGPPFRSGKFFMHTRAIDVCIEIVKHRYIADKSSTWHVRRWNLGYSGNPYMIDEVKNYRIEQEHYADYHEIDPVALSLKRADSWDK